MIRYLSNYIIIILLIFSVSAELCAFEITQKEKITMKLMSEVLKEHYSGEDMSGSFSERAYALYLKSLDYNKRFLLKEDVEKLFPYGQRMGEDFLSQNTSIIEVSKELMNKRIDVIRNYSDELLARPLNLDEDESVELDAKKRDYCSNVGEQMDLLRKYIKYEVLLQYQELIAEKSNAGGTFDPEIEKEAREKVERNFDQVLDRLAGEKDEDRFYRYLNVIAEAFDPHTSFMSPIDKKDFEMTISGTFEGIGAQLKEVGEDISVQEIIPGSAAWRQNILKSGDIILKVAQGAGEPVEVVNMPVKDVVKLIRGPKGTEVRLTIRKPDGRILILPIIRDKVVLEDTYVRTDIIEDPKSDKKYGYICLPIFYGDFVNENGRNSSDDMRRALEQLKELGVSGIILDLRNNGGGLLKDAIQIAGLFIKGGPVVQVKLSGGKSREYDDPDSGIVYSGPLVILVNEFSASASEIVAAALQDYSRAVIVGDHTFGKGTVQQVVDLDSLLIFDDMKPLGSVKITVQKFYRINGDSTQQKGVIGDISLPDPYNGMEIGENSMDYPLEWDTTEVLKYSKWVPEYDIEVMREKSRDRVSKNEIFNMIVSNAMLLSNQINSPRSLRLLRFMEEQKNIKEIGERLNKILESTNFLNVSIPASEKSESDYNERKDKLESYSKLLSKDIYADEAVNILDDINNSVVVSTGVP